MTPKVYSVTQVNFYIRGLLEKDFILQSLWMRGEISNWKRHSSGHCYFTLKDSESAMACLMFRGDAMVLPFTPQNGQEVIVCGYVGVYEKTGQYQFYAQLMEPAGVGALSIAFTQLKEKLEQEGLFDADFKREINPYPKTVAVITSPTGAAVRDIIQIAKRRDPSVQLVVVPALVQGQEAAASLVSAIKQVNAWGKADTIILGRGGGSMEDLWAFNEEVVARAIFASSIPIISAVGHETDVTIADFVADLRAPTPSAAAELAVPDRQAERDRLHALTLRIQFAEDKFLQHGRQMVLSFEKRAGFRRPMELLAQGALTLSHLEERMDRALTRQLQEEQNRLLGLCDKLDLLSPMKVLGRGYALAKKESGQLVRQVDDVEEGEKLSLLVTDGTIGVTVTKKEKIHGKEKTDV